MEVAARADVIKLNDDEVSQLASWLQTGSMTPNPPVGADEIGKACAALAAATGAARICVTRGAAGAVWWEPNTPLAVVPAPPTAVQDTIGAGGRFHGGTSDGTHAGGLTPVTVLEGACRLGACVASQAGATPPLPREIAQEVLAALGG